MFDFNARLYWSTPIIEVRNPEHAAIKPGLVKLAYAGQKLHGDGVTSGIAPYAKGGLYESPFNLFSAGVAEVQSLAQFCARALHEAVVRTDHQLRGGANKLEHARIELFESWVHITRDGGFHEQHMHPNCSWCGIYYVENGDSTMDPPNGVNRFFPPFASNYEDAGSLVCPLDPIQPTPEEGKLILFPSYVRHSAALYRGTRDRIVIAFNARISKPRPELHFPTP
jgi:uncharacterized protein (TIGR02466 family)